MGGAFVISLDFELYWGIRDHTSLHDARERMLGARRAVPVLLDLFREYDVHATWATVGALFAESREELEHFAPVIRPEYREDRLSAYHEFGGLGRSEASAPCHFAPSLIKLIAESPNQELGSHSFSHIYCLEPGITADAFAADFEAAVAIARHHQYELTSLVFPRNQYSELAVSKAGEAGLETWRANALGSMHSPGAEASQTRLRRAMRLVDDYLPFSEIAGYRTTRPGASELRGFELRASGAVPASQFLRPYRSSLALGARVRHRRISAAMTQAAMAGRPYHLWWHPHNWGADLCKNSDSLRRVLDHFSALREQYQMISMTMKEASAGF